MHVHNKVPVLILDVLEANVPKDSSIVDQNIDASKVLDSSLDDLLAIGNAVVVSYSFPTRRFDFIDDNIGSLCLGLAMLVSVLELACVRGRQSATGKATGKARQTYSCGGALSLERAAQIVHNDTGASRSKEGSICLAQAAAGPRHHHDLAIVTKF